MGGPGSGRKPSGERKATNLFTKKVDGKPVGRWGKFRREKGTTISTQKHKVTKNPIGARKHFSPKKY